MAVTYRIVVFRAVRLAKRFAIVLAMMADVHPLHLTQSDAFQFFVSRNPSIDLHGFFVQFAFDGWDVCEVG